MLDDDHESIEALSLYPVETRNDILEASQYPELIVRISAMQENTRQQFSDLLAEYPQQDQARFWNVSRYPTLLEKLAVKGGVTEGKVEDILRDYPEAVHEDARWADEYHHRTLMHMQDLMRSSGQAFDALLATYPPATRAAYKRLINLPEVMDILAGSLSTTVLVGDLYRRDPAWVRGKLDSLSIEAARRNAEDLQAWRDSLAANPQAAEDLRQSAEEFRSQYQGYGESAPVQNVNVYYHWDPYPWWFGYPSWYDYPCWYPYPYWYHYGFYMGPGNVIVVYYLPSPWFTTWYFHHPWHHYHHPHLTNCFIRYHEGHRDSHSGFNMVVSHWMRDNQGTFGNNLPADNPGRIEHIREYGKFETDYQAAVQAAPDQVITRDNYLQDHGKKYPALLQAASKPQPARPEDQGVKQPDKPATVKPQPAKPQTDKPQPVKPQPVKRPTEQPVKPTQRPPVQQNPPENKWQIDRAPDYHREKWQPVKVTPSQPQRPVQVSPTRPSQPVKGVKPAGGTIKGR